MYTFRGPRRKLTAEETAANRAAKLAREAAAMHCQCCGREILANKGVIAHHGYTRPYEGWQTASCVGARQLPFEVDRKALGKYIDMLRDFRKRTANQLAEVLADRAPVPFDYSVYNQSKREHKRVWVKREEFDGLKAGDLQPYFRMYSVGQFEDLIKKYNFKVESELRHLDEDIKSASARFNSWKQTHRWNPTSQTWEKV